MTPQEFLDEFGTLAESAEGVPKLRELILDLAVQGKLVEQDSNDEPADRLLTRISQTRQQLIDAGTQRASKETPALSAAEAPFELPPTWVWTPLGNVQNFVNGFTFKSQEYQTEGVGIVRIGDIQRGEISTDGMKLVATRYLTELDERLHVRPGDLLIAMSGATTGKLGFNGTNSTFLLNQRVGKLDFLEVNSNYAHLFLQTQVQENLRISSGSAIPNLSTTQINSMPFPLPPLAEQHRIVAKVDELMGLCDRLEAVQGQRRGVRVRLNRSSLDRLTSVSGVDRAGRSGLSAAWQRVCDHFEVLYDTLPDLRQTILQLAVQGKLVPQDPNDEPASSFITGAAEAMPDDPPSSGWTWCRLQQVCEFLGGFAFKSTSYVKESVNQIIRLGNVKNDVLLLDQKPAFIPDDIAGESGDYRIQPGDMLLTMTGTKKKRDYLFTTLVRDADLESRVLYLNQRVGLLRFANEQIAETANYFLKSDAILDPLFATATGTANQGNIGAKAIRSALFPLPPLSEQKRIVSKVTHLLSQVTRLESTLTRRESTRTQLLIAAIHSLLNPEASS